MTGGLPLTAETVKEPVLTSRRNGPVEIDADICPLNELD